jgi:pyridoxal phosphate enzyme (YggS family)
LAAAVIERAGPDATADRRGELAANMRQLGLRIERACAAAGRSVDDVTLIAVTKTFPASDVVLLAGLGISDVGENRDQEAAAKVAAVREHQGGEQGAASMALRWHFIGALQTNKCASVVSYACLVHSVDRLRLVHALDRAAGVAKRRVRCLVQVDLDEVSRPGRAGARPNDVAGVAAAIARAAGLQLAGVMAVAPLGAEPTAAFERLARVADAVRQSYGEATMISAGMSGDLEPAVANGATHLRVGAALLGVRRHPVR